MRRNPKIVTDRKRLAAILARKRRAGKKIALTNGVFDLLHVGHLRSLEDAKRRADVLVVAVNSDRSTRRYKGPGRPIVPAVERMELLAALSCVDHVTVFDEPTVTRLILALKPHWHAKGTDYTPKTDPERDAMAAVGGKTLIVGDAKDHSVTDLIARVKLLAGDRSQESGARRRQKRRPA